MTTTNSAQSLSVLLATLFEAITPGLDRELTVGEAAFLRGVSESTMRKRIVNVAAWRNAFFYSGTSKELRTTIRRLRIAEEGLTVR